MPVYGFKERPIALTLKQVAEERIARVHGRENATLPKVDDVMPKAGLWIVEPQQHLVPSTNKDTPNPPVPGWIHDWNSTNSKYVRNATKTIEIFDPTNQSCLFKTETIYARKRRLDFNGTVKTVYEVVGSKGLERKAMTVNGDIDCNGEGQFRFYVAQTTVTDCSSYELYNDLTPQPVCNHFYNLRPVVSGSDFTVAFDISMWRWYIKELLQAIHATADVMTENCPEGMSESASVQNLVLKDWWEKGCSKTIAGPVTVKNPYRLAWNYGATVELRRDIEVADPTAANAWEIIEVKHREEDVIINVTDDTAACPIKLSFDKLKVSLMACNNPVPKDIFLGSELDVITSWEVGSSDCSLAVKKATVCVLRASVDSDISPTLVTQKVLTAVNYGDCSIAFEAAEVCVFRSDPAAPDGIPAAKKEVVSGLRLDPGTAPDECKMVIEKEFVCVIGDGTPEPAPDGRLDFDFEEVLQDWDVGENVSGNCAITKTKVKICTFGAVVQPPEETEMDYEVVGEQISESGNCVNLEKKSIPVMPGCLSKPETEDVIYCVVDCETQPTTVLDEANAPGTYSVGNRETRPYDPSGTTLETDIVIEFPSPAVEGDIVHVANNTMSQKPITLDGNGHNVQAISAPYTAATAVVWGAKLSINYQLRKITTGPDTFEWRII